LSGVDFSRNSVYSNARLRIVSVAQDVWRDGPGLFEALWESVDGAEEQVFLQEEVAVGISIRRGAILDFEVQGVLKEGKKGKKKG